MEPRARDLSGLTRFLDQHRMGVDELFFLLHLGARQLSLKPDVPAPVREHWRKVSEECYDLWHNMHPTGVRLE